MSGGGSDSAYTYDDLGRVLTETDSSGITKEYTYDTANNRLSLAIKQNGVVKTSTTYTYDRMNRLSQVYENGMPIATYTFDANGNRATLTYPNGDSVEYSYNLANKLLSLINKRGNEVLSWYTYTYYLDGNQESKTDSAGTTNYVYDGLERLVSESKMGGKSRVYAYGVKGKCFFMTLIFMKSLWNNSL